jgi:hypothetical protein
MGNHTNYSMEKEKSFFVRVHNVTSIYVSTVRMNEKHNTITYIILICMNDFKVIF